MRCLNQYSRNKFLFTTALAILFTFPSFNANALGAGMDDDGHHDAVDAAAPKASLYDNVVRDVEKEIAVQDQQQEKLHALRNEIQDLELGELHQALGIRGIVSRGNVPQQYTQEQLDSVDAKLTRYDSLVRKAGRAEENIMIAGDNIVAMVKALDEADEKMRPSKTDLIAKEKAESTAAVAAVNGAINEQFDEAQALAKLVEAAPLPPVIPDGKAEVDPPAAATPVVVAAAASVLPAGNTDKLDNTALITRSKGAPGRRAPTLRRNRAAAVAAAPIGDTESAAASVPAVVVAEAPADAAPAAAGPRPKAASTLNPFGTLGAAGLKGTLRRTNSPAQFRGQ